MLFIISSGRGPVECERAVYKYFVYLKKEFETKEVKYKVLNEEEYTNLGKIIPHSEKSYTFEKGWVDNI